MALDLSAQASSASLPKLSDKQVRQDEVEVALDAAVCQTKEPALCAVLLERAIQSLQAWSKFSSCDVRLASM